MILLVVESRHLQIKLFLQIFCSFYFYFALQFRKHDKGLILRLLFCWAEGLLFDIFLQLSFKVLDVIVVLKLAFKIVLAIVHFNFFRRSSLHFHGSFNLPGSLLLIVKGWISRVIGELFSKGLSKVRVLIRFSQNIFGN